MAKLKTRFRPAITEWLQYGEDDYAEYSVLGQCDEHGLERIVSERDISTGADLCRVGVFLCGAINKDDVF